MRSRYVILSVILLTALLFPCAYAIPSLSAPEFMTINSSFIRFGAAQITGDTCWFEYGVKENALSWRTDNVSTSMGATCFKNESGTPLIGGTTYYYRCCDSSGCSVQYWLTLPSVTPAPTTTFGVTAQNISRSHFDIAEVGTSIIEPYTWVTGSAQILFGVLLFFVFTGLWLRQREVILPIILGMIGSGLLLYSGATNPVGIPPEMLIIVIGLVTAGITGVIVSILKR